LGWGGYLPFSGLADAVLDEIEYLKVTAISDRLMGNDELCVIFRHVGCRADGPILKQEYKIAMESTCLTHDLLVSSLKINACIGCHTVMLHQLNAPKPTGT